MPDRNPHLIRELRTAQRHCIGVGIFGAVLFLASLVSLIAATV